MNTETEVNNSQKVPLSRCEGINSNDSSGTKVIKIDSDKKQQLSNCFGTENKELIEYFLKDSLYFDSVQNGTPTANLDSTLAMFNGIAPKDELEGMLAVQMVFAHKLAMNFMKRAASLGKSKEVIDLQLTRANKLMKTFTNQMQTLTKYRQKGQQQMIVKRINVNSGGQAVVGTVNHSTDQGG